MRRKTSQVPSTIYHALKLARTSFTKPKTVSFVMTRQVRIFQDKVIATMITYDSGADGHYLSERNCKSVGLPIIRPSTKLVGVANGGTSTARHVSCLPFKQLSDRAAIADSFEDFPSSLMSVGKTSDDGSISIFTKEGVTVYKEQDVLITCKGEPMLIGIRDDKGRHHIPLVQQRGHWNSPECNRLSNIERVDGCMWVHIMPWTPILCFASYILYSPSKCWFGILLHPTLQEEAQFAAFLSKEFCLGLSEIENGTTKRVYLSSKLACTNMRISKKFKGKLFLSWCSLACLHSCQVSHFEWFRPKF